MCGIVGYIGPRDATPIILNGLKRLEYRGYDSAGLAVLEDGQHRGPPGCGQACRTWSTWWTSRPSTARRASGTPAGPPTARPAPATPIRTSGSTGQVVVVHNGIVENFLELQATS